MRVGRSASGRLVFECRIKNGRHSAIHIESTSGRMFEYSPLQLCDAMMVRSIRVRCNDSYSRGLASLVPTMSKDMARTPLVKIPDEV
jgi:hypothetical protein